MAKLPALQFYTGDWLKDPGVRACSYAAKGLWMDMLCIMSEASPRGYLQVNGAPLPPATLARMSGGAVGDVILHLAELDSAGVYSRDRNGVIYSRRIVRDEKARTQAKRFGRLGGNPLLLNHSNSPLSGGLTPVVNPTLKMKRKMKNSSGEGAGGEECPLAKRTRNMLTEALNDRARSPRNGNKAPAGVPKDE